MKKHRNVYRIILLVASLFTIFSGLSACTSSSGDKLPSSTAAPTAKVTPGPLTILSIVGGKVLVMKPGDNEWADGTKGMTLAVDYKIKTEAGGHATITFFEGSTIELDSDTEISLAELNLEGTANKIKVSQAIGNTISRVKKLVDPASSFEIETRAAVAGVRGTILNVSVDAAGVTVVGNIEGLISVVAQGVEVELTKGMRTTVLPGHSPGEPESLTPTPTQTSSAGRGTTAARTTPPTTSTPVTAKIGIVKTCDRLSGYPGDTVTYQYQVSNEGDVPLSNITVTDNRAGSPAYVSGDNNGDNVLDLNEIWLFTADYTVKNGDTGKLTNHATASGKGPGNQSAVASGSVTINISDIVVEITSLQPDALVGRNITVSGTVNDPSITQAVLTLNDSPVNLAIVNGQFSTTLELADGVNHITVTLTKAGGITRSDSKTLYPDSGER